MNCWNCGHPVAEGAKSCAYCEKKLDDPDDILTGLQAKLERKDLSEPERAAIHQQMEEMQLLVKKLWDSLDEGAQDQMLDLVKNSSTADEFAAAIFVGDCPKCGSSQTEDCDEVAGIENCCVGRCKTCATLFCCECGQIHEQDKVSDATATCPRCGGTNTNFKEIEKLLEEDQFEQVGMLEYYECYDCELPYCSICGKPVEIAEEDDEEEESF